MKSLSRKNEHSLSVTLWNVRNVAPLLSFRHGTIFAGNAVSRLHPFHGKPCPTCDEHPRLQRFCPDCRDRGVDIQGRPVKIERVPGGNSGNVLWTRLQEERQKIAEEAVELERQIRYRMCPECDTLGYIPEDDYICEDCRHNEGL